MNKPERTSLFVRNMVFGVEDSLVSTVGLLSGIAAVGVPHQYILMTGFILIFVEGISMAIGSFLSEESVEELERGSEAKVRAPVLGAAVMFLSYIVAGFVPLLPYLLAVPNALVWSIVLSLLTLALVGYVQARISKMPPVSRMLRIALLGGFAILVGVLVGKVFGGA